MEGCWLSVVFIYHAYATMSRRHTFSLCLSTHDFLGARLEAVLVILAPRLVSVIIEH